MPNISEINGYGINAVSASYAANGGVTQLLAGSNITLSPIDGKGQVTVSATLSGSTIFNTATGSYGSFYDTTTQTNLVGNIPRSMSFNSTDITNGVSISGSTNPFNTYIKTTNAGVYNIQFSAQIDKTDSGADEIVIWLRKNGIDLTDTATTLTLSGNNDKKVAAWNWFVTSAANDYYQIIWISTDTDLRLLAEPISGTHPGIPSVIATVNRVDQFLSNTGSFSGSFNGSFTGSLFGTASWATNALTASFVNTASTNAFVQNGNSFGAQAVLGTNDNQSLAFETSGSTRMFISSSGRVGIGTITPLYTLDTVGNVRLTNAASQLIIDNATYSELNYGASNYFRANGTAAVINGPFIQFLTGGTERMRFSSGGNLLIGTTTDSARLTVKGSGATSATTALLVQNSTPTTLFQIQDHGSSSFAGNMTVTGSITGFVPLTSSGSLASLNGYQAPYAHEAFIEVGMRQLDAGIPVGISILGGSNIAGTRGGFLESRRDRRALSFNELGIVSIATTQISSSQYSALSIGAAATSIGSLTPNRAGIQLAVLPRSILMTGDAALQQEVSFNSFATSSLRINIFATTYTNAYNVYIEGQPTAGSNVTFTNAYSLYVNSGKTYLGGNTLIGTTTDAGFRLDVSGSSRFTNGLTVTGSLIAPSITGSLQGTASWANNAISASYAVNHKVVTSTYVVQGKLSANQLIPTASDTTIQFIDDFDPNNWWDASTYRFTPTVAGYYNISFGVWFDNMATTSSNQINAQVRKNSNAFIIIQQPCQNGTGISLGGTKMAYLNGSTDYIDFTAYNGALVSKNILQGTADGSGTWFSAFLLVQ